MKIKGLEILFLVEEDREIDFKLVPCLIGSKHWCLSDGKESGDTSYSRLALELNAL